MASIKAIAAIALTLMIAVPIGLGYAFASETVTSTDYEVTETKNITAQLENGEMPSQANFTNNPANNQSVFLGQTSYDEDTTLMQTSQTSVSLEAVDYKADDVSASSWRNYTWTAHSVSLTAVTATTYYVGTDSTYATIGSSNLSPAASISGIAIHLDIETWPDQEDPGLYTELTFYDETSSTTVFAPVSASLVQDSSAGTYHIEAVDHYGAIFEMDDVTGWKLASAVDLRVLAYTQTSYTESISSSVTFYEYAAPSAMAFWVNTSDSTVTKYYGVSSGTLVTYISGTLYLGDLVISNVSSMLFDAAENIGTLTYYTYSTSTYGDPSQGWYLPRLITDDTDADYSDWMTAYWFNKQSNMTVNMWVYLPSGEEVRLTPVNHFAVNAGAEAFNSIELLYGTVGSQTGLFVKETGDTDYTYLGTYHYVYVSFTDTQITVGCSTYLPDAYAAYTVYSSWSMDYYYIGNPAPYAPSVPFSYIKIDLPNDYDGTLFRVDACAVIGEPLPATVDLTWNWYEKFPDTSLDLYFKSITAYGTSLGVAGTTYTVTSGAVSFTDLDGTARTVALLGSTIKVVYDSDDGYYDVYIGGYPVKENATVETLVFNGTWSVVMTASKLSAVTTSSQQWAPGEFAFGKEDFAACGLLVAGACLIGLGMTGSRSGIKMGVLLMICGGAGLIYLTII